MTRVMGAVSCLGLGLAAACSSPGGEAGAGAFRVDSGVGEAVYVPAHLECEVLDDSVAEGELTRAALLARLGSPDSVYTATEPNRHVPGATDSLFTFYYPGLEARFRTPANAGDLVELVSITDERFRAAPGVGIGVSDSAVIASLGMPRERTASVLVYDCGREVEQPVTFWLSDGRVNRITIDYYVD